MDIVFIGALGAFLLVTWLLAVMCERLGGLK
jgi:hypothetical protein